MARIKYYYDTETCKYERLKPSKGEVFLNITGFLLVTMLCGGLLLTLYLKFFESPKEALLRKENEELMLHHELIDKEMQEISKVMLALQQRDDNIYRAIFEASPIPATVRAAGVGGVNRYQDLFNKGLEKEELIIETVAKVDALKKQMYIQTKSYDEVMALVKNKSRMLACIPAIQPISNKHLSALASGFGMRIHPIYKVKKMHTGVDFSAKRGTPIYATGDGVVIAAENSSGYGLQVELNHGYGYITKYAHMQKCIVKKGQRVKRGEIIGYVGASGTASGTHLHYEVIKDGSKVNPVYYFFNDLNAKEFEKILELASIENQSLS